MRSVLMAPASDGVAEVPLAEDIKVDEEYCPYPRYSATCRELGCLGLCHESMDDSDYMFGAAITADKAGAFSLDYNIAARETGSRVLPSVAEFTVCDGCPAEEYCASNNQCSDLT